IRLTTPGALTFPIVKANVNDVVLVSDDEVREAVRFLALRAHLVAEPTGAVTAAAVLSGRLPLEPGSRVGVVLSGGNVDPDLLSPLPHGWAPRGGPVSARRYVRPPATSRRSSVNIR